MQDPKTPQTTLYFDGACPVCSREIAMYKTQDGAADVRWVDVSTCELAELGDELDRQTALSQMHVRLADGTLVGGAQAFTQLWLVLPKWAWLGRVLGSGAGLMLIKLCYWVFLKIRPLWRRAA